MTIVLADGAGGSTNVTLRFVDSIAASPTVRLNLNDGTTLRLNQHPDFSPPPLRRAIADSGVLRDGAEIPASAYDNRVLGLPLILEAATEDALATAFQNLNRELNRARNILEFNVGQTSSVFFRTFRSPDYDLDMEHGSPRAKVLLRVHAEPFAYGLREEASSVTVSPDPAAGSNGCFLDVTGVKGDVETPAFIQITNPSGTQGRRFNVGVRRRGTPSDLTFFRQCESMTLGTDVTSVAEAAASGGNVAECTFSNNSFNIPRLTTNIPFTGTPTDAQRLAARGKYRLLLVARRDDGVAGAFDAKFVINTNWTAGTVTSSPVTVQAPASDAFGVTDLGLLSIPTGFGDQEPGYSGITAGAAGNTQVQLRVTRTSGTSSLFMDFLIWIPADQEFSVLDLGGATAGEDAFIDGPNGSLYHASETWESSGNYFGIEGTPTFYAPPKFTGGTPMLTPNQTNRLVILQEGYAEIGPGFHYDKAHTSPQVIVHHWPRYLYVQGA